jgi:Uma2 family endonuclease
MSLKIQSPPAETTRRFKASYEEYLRLANGAQIMEWVDGEVISYMPPIPEHQHLAFFISHVLKSFVEYFNLGEVMILPLEVKLWPGGPSREPDVIFVSRQNQARIAATKIEGPPDLIVEVISPGSVSEDRVRKFTEYEQAGVGEYWLIDPRPPQQQADFYILDAAGQFQAAALADNGLYHSQIIPGLWFNPEWLWPRPLPLAQLVFAEIMLTQESLPAEVKAAFQLLHDTLARR